MWFDVKAALAEHHRSDASGACSENVQSVPRVAHVARVARSQGSKSETAAGSEGEPGDAANPVRELTTDERDQYEERAAILQYDGGFPRPEAESRARLEVVGGKDFAPGETRDLTRLWPSK